MTSEAKIESLIIAMLKLGAGIEVPVTGMDDDRHLEEDRIVVIRDQRTPSLAAHKESVMPKAWQCNFMVEAVVATMDAAQIDALMLAVDTVMQAASPPAVIVTQGLALFPSGGVYLNLETSGEVNPDNAEVRRRSRTYIARWIEG